MNAQEMLKLEKWAVIGASNKEDSFGSKIYKVLKETGHVVYPITPNYETVQGDKAYKSISDLPEKVDVAEFIVNREVGYKVIRECARVGIKNIWLQPGARSEEILKFAADSDMVVIQSCVLVETNKSKQE